MATTTGIRIEHPVHILLHGAGAVGCFYASRLHHPDRNVFVSLSARSNYAAIAEHGVWMETRNFGDYIFKPYAVFKGITGAVPKPLAQPPTPSSSSGVTTPSISHGGPVPDKWDIIIVATKSLPDHPPNDAETIAPVVTPGHTAIVTIQNGIGIEAPFREKFPTNPILTGITVVSASQTSLGTVKQNRWTRMHMGPWGLNGQPAKGEEDKKLELDLLNRGMIVGTDLARWWGSEPKPDTTHDEAIEEGRKAEPPSSWGGIKDVHILEAGDMQCVRWHKLAINAAFNPSAVLSGGKGNAELVEDFELRIHVKGVMEEVLSVGPLILGLEGGAMPARLALADPETIMKSTARNAGAKPSMLQDWEAGRAMETEVILGNMVRIAREHGVEAGLGRCQAMYGMMRSLQERRDKEKEMGEQGKGSML